MWHHEAVEFHVPKTETEVVIHLWCISPGEVDNVGVAFPGLGGQQGLHQVFQRSNVWAQNPRNCWYVQLPWGLKSS